MGDEFYCTLKLVSGEEIFSLVSIESDDESDNPILLLQNPVTIKISQTQHGTIIKVKPWIDMSQDDIYLIRLDKVITMTEVKDKKLIDFYNKYLSDDDENVYTPGGKVNISEEMGYVSSVEKSREILEKLYNESKE